MDKHKAVFHDQKHKFVAQRLIQDATQLVTASCDAGNRSSDFRRISTKGAWCVHTEPERSVEQLRHDHAAGGGV